MYDNKSMLIGHENDMVKLQGSSIIIDYPEKAMARVRVVVAKSDIDALQAR